MTVPFSRYRGCLLASAAGDALGFLLESVRSEERLADLTGGGRCPRQS